MSIVLELNKKTDGTGFVICVCGERTNRRLIIPLSGDLSHQIERLTREENVKAEGLILPPQLRGKVMTN
jgi:hypothetical protein